MGNLALPNVDWRQSRATDGGVINGPSGPEERKIRRYPWSRLAIPKFFNVLIPLAVHAVVNLSHAVLQSFPATQLDSSPILNLRL